MKEITGATNCSEYADLSNTSLDNLSKKFKYQFRKYKKTISEDFERLKSLEEKYPGIINQEKLIEMKYVNQLFDSSKSFKLLFDIEDLSVKTKDNYNHYLNFFTIEENLMNKELLLRILNNENYVERIYQNILKDINNLKMRKKLLKMIYQFHCLMII